MPRKKIKFDKKALAKIESLAALGISRANIARACNICEATLYNKQNECPEFRAALEKGRARAETAAAEELWSLINGGNVAATIFFLKARCGWKEGTEIDINANISGNVNVSLEQMSDAELQQLVAEGNGDGRSADSDKEH